MGMMLWLSLRCLLRSGEGWNPSVVLVSFGRDLSLGGLWLWPHLMMMSNFSFHSPQSAGTWCGEVGGARCNSARLSLLG